MCWSPNKSNKMTHPCPLSSPIATQTSMFPSLDWRVKSGTSLYQQMGNFAERETRVCSQHINILAQTQTSIV